MSIGEELLDIYTSVVDPETDFQRVGIIDHDGVRAFITAFGEELAENLDAPPLAKNLAGTMASGIYVGLEYARRFQETNGRLPWEVPEE